jgi:anaerobic ribonucleoside-triphosphate reductase activating protein
MAYSGFTYDELWNAGPQGSRRLLRALDILVDGPYLRETPRRHPWAGSGNQRVLKLTAGAVAEEMLAAGPVESLREFHVLDDGTVVTTGF